MQRGTNWCEPNLQHADEVVGSLADEVWFRSDGAAAAAADGHWN